ncbi:threonine dehydratase [Modestobacter marinus]|uniref:threonine dehydratase n=1 Tax=Modestobacter marinus TaxID=477641 RepID=UPI001C95A40B|nr:threonine dehydratase [Modestobacter marinus]
MITRAELDAALRTVRPHVPVTPAYRWPLLEQVTGTPTWVKHENATPTGAFKVRGGLVHVAGLRNAGRPVRGIVSATRGNHGQSLAYAGRVHGIPVTIVVPEGNSPDKNAAMQGFGAELVVHGRDFQEAREHALLLAEERGLQLVPSFCRDLVAGVATYAAELHEQAPDLDVVYVPVGQGSGLCANIAVRDLLGRRTEVVGVGAQGAPAYALSFRARRPVSTPVADTFVDGVATRVPDEDAVDVMLRGAARFVLVDDEATERAMRLLWRTTHQMPEPAGAIALAGLLADTARPAAAVAAAVMTGGNCDSELVRRVVAEG